eukprot:g969.t1
MGQKRRTEASPEDANQDERGKTSIGQKLNKYASPWSEYFRDLFWKTVNHLKTSRRTKYYVIFLVCCLLSYRLRSRSLTKRAAASSTKATTMVAKTATVVAKELAFGEFLSLVNANRVRDVQIGPSQFHFQIVNENTGESKNVTTSPGVTRPIPSIHSPIAQLLASKNIPFRAASPSPSSRVLPVVMIAVPFLYLGIVCWVAYKLYNEGVGGIGKRSKKKRKRRGLFSSGAEEQSTAAISFDQIAGIDHAKEQVMEIITCMKNPSRYQLMGARVPRGLLLSGPPGCGKTMLARALAAESNASFFYCCASDFVEVFSGRGAARVRNLFATAKAASPSILFIDELDAVGKKRNDFSMNEEREQTLNALLSCLDGFEQNDGKGDESQDGGKNSLVILVAATNRYDVLDPALVRPGRFDRVIPVQKPSVKGRQAILKVHLRKKRLAKSLRQWVGTSETDINSVLETINEGQRNSLQDTVELMESLVQSCAGFSGADLENVCNEAALLACRLGDNHIHANHLTMALDGFQKGRGIPSPTGQGTSPAASLFGYLR